MSMADDDNTNTAAVGTLDAFLKKRASERFDRFLTEAPGSLLGGGWKDADLGAAPAPEEKQGEQRKQGDDHRFKYHSSDDDEATIKIYPLSELMKRKLREELVPNLLFKKGITTLVAPSGEGKTTLAMSIALLVASGGTCGGKKIDPRGVIWIAGEGEDDLPPMVQAVAKHHRLDWEKLEIGISFEAVDFSSEKETDELIDKLQGQPPMLIIADALADIIGVLDEDKAQHITQVYKNLREVEKKTGSAILVLHHQGWTNGRERGSTATRAKSDIMPRIVAFKPEDGYVELAHLKRRGGPKLEKFGYELKLIQVAGCEQLVPIVTGVTKAAPGLLDQDWAAAEEGAQQLVQIVMQWPDGTGKPTYTRLMERSGMKKSTFDRARDEAVKVKTWLIVGSRKGYQLNPNDCWKEALAGAPRRPPEVTPSTSLSPIPSKEGIGSERECVTPNESELGVIGSESKSRIPLPPNEADEAAEALALSLDTAALLKKAEKR
jgi:hypothetical protein